MRTKASQSVGWEVRTGKDLKPLKRTETSIHFCTDKYKGCGLISTEKDKVTKAPAENAEGEQPFEMS